MARYKNKEESTKARFNKFLNNEVIKSKTNYDFSESIFTTQSKPLTFRCSIHDIKITVARANYLYDKKDLNNKCTECNKEFIDFYRAEDFIVRAKRKYNSKYEYLDIDEYYTHKEITFICPIHGEQKHTPRNHMQSVTGCTECGREISNQSGGFSKQCYINRSNTSNIYVIKITGNNESFYKIGLTSKSIEQRFLNGSLPSIYNLETKYIFKDIPTDIAYEFEKTLHKNNKNNKYDPIIKFGGYTECFTRVPEDINEYLDILETLN